MAAILDVLRKRTVAGDYAYVEKDMGGVAYFGTSKTALLDKADETNQISWWKICTPAMDREGDILVPRGCLGTLDTYAANPGVMYDHKRDFKLPIGTSVGKSGQPVDVTDDCIIAGCKHDDTTQFARDVAALVFKDVLRGCSIAFVPLQAEKIHHKAHNDAGRSFAPRYKFSAWNMTEWSICPIGHNPEALRIHLAAGNVKTPELLKSLEPLAQKPKILVQSGFTPEEDMVSFEDIKRDDIAAVRFHKSKFTTLEDCHKWLVEKGLDKSLMSDHQKSWDFEQSAVEISEKTAKVDDGVYVVYSKAAPPFVKKKKKESDEEDPSKPAKKPFGDTEEEGDDAKPDKKPASAENGDDEDEEVAARDEGAEEEGEGDIAGDMEDEEVAPPDAEGMEGGDVGDPGVDQSGSPTYAGQALIDIAKHKAAEVRFYEQSLEAHDHDGLKALMQKELQACRQSYQNWLNEAKRLFPNLDVESMSMLDDEAGDDEAKAPMGLNEGAGSEGGVMVDSKVMKSLSDDDWAVIAIQTALG